MSHLDHIVRFKNALTERGVTCPFYQQDLVQEAYFRALVRAHFREGCVLNIPEHLSGIYWRQLDRWNCVSPLKAQMIMHKFTTFMNQTRNALIQTGYVQEEKNEIELSIPTDQHGELPPAVKTIGLCEIPEFTDLVSYLVREVECKDE